MLEQPCEGVLLELGAAPDPIGRVDQQLVAAGADLDRVLREGLVELGVDDVDARADEREPVPDREAVDRLHGALVRG